MRSKLGFFGAISFLIAVPIALLAQNIFGNNAAETVIHFVCGTGFVLSAMAVFDFKLPSWMTWIGFVSTGAVGIIFLIQGVSNLMPNNDWLFNLAFRVLGQGLEGWLIDLFTLWLIAVLFVHSQGWTKIFGIVVMSIVVVVEIYRIILISSGGNFPGALKLLSLLALVWFLLESKKRNSFDALTPKTSMMMRIR
jgi:hypothetical protein